MSVMGQDALSNTALVVGKHSKVMLNPLVNVGAVRCEYPCGMFRDAVKGRVPVMFCHFLRPPSFSYV
jgi:hypothetical protein